MGFGASKMDRDYPPITPILVPSSLKGYPPPKPPHVKKVDVIKPSTIAAIDARAKKVAITNTTSYFLLATALTHGMVYDVDKVRAIFSWVGNQHIVENAYPGVDDPTTPRGYMKLIKKGMGTYTDLFTQICRAVGIPTVIVRGRCRADDYQAGDLLSAWASTSWAVVFVDGDWMIVHPSMAFPGVPGHVQNCRRLTQRQNHDTMNSRLSTVDEFFFLPDPEHFVYVCWAESSEWQLVTRPWSFTDFSDVPYFHSPYFTSGLTLASEHKCTLTSQAGVCYVSFEHRYEAIAQLRHVLIRRHSSIGNLLCHSNLEMHVCKEAMEGRVNVYVRLPSPGVYTLVIYGGLNNTKLYPLTEFRLDCHELNYCNMPFPIRSSIGFGYGPRAFDCGLVATSHFTGVVPIGSKTQEIFEFSHPNPSELNAVLRHSYIPEAPLKACVRKQVSHQRVQFHVCIPQAEEEDEFALQIYSRQSQSQNVTNVLNYLLTNCLQLTDHLANIPVAPLEMEKVGRKLVNPPDVCSAATTIHNNANVTIAFSSQSQVWKTEEDLLWKNLRTATETRNRRELEKSVLGLLSLEYEAASLDKEIHVLGKLYEEAAQTMRLENDSEGLTKLLFESRNSVARAVLEKSSVLDAAGEFLGHQLRVKQYGDVIQTLTRPTIADIADHILTNDISCDVMRAVLMLLGEDTTSLQKRIDIQEFLLLPGDKGIVSRLGNFSVDTPTPRVIRQVNETLGQYSIANVKATDYGVAAFYLWAFGVVKEMSD